MLQLGLEPDILIPEPTVSIAVERDKTHVRGHPTIYNVQDWSKSMKP